MINHALYAFVCVCGCFLMLSACSAEKSYVIDRCCFNGRTGRQSCRRILAGPGK